MKSLVSVACALACAGSMASAAAAASMPAPSQQLVPIFTVLPARGVNDAALPAQAATSLTIPFFQNSVTSPLDGHTYSFRIVGTDPTTSLVSTSVTYVPLALRVHFPDGTVLDPTKPGCNDTVSVVKRFYGSPLFVNVPLKSNGIAVGNTQIIDGFQRAEFWKLVKGSNYHVLLAASANPKVVDVTAPAGSSTQPGACAGSGHNLGKIDINAWDNIVVGLNNKYAKPNELPIVAAYNVVETAGGCCIIGYHSAYGRRNGTQTYATGAYTDAGIFSPGLQDIHAWTHEIGEWANDPFVNNATPAWGHTGQVSGCQNNLEVGDPLTGTPFIVSLNGFTYHPQELAFFSWFFRTPALGTARDFSFNESFETSQGVCH